MPAIYPLPERLRDLLVGSRGTDAPGYVEQATEALGSAASSASEMAQGAYDQGRRYAREAAERYPQAGDYYRKSREVARAYAPENPMLSLLLGAAIGYGMAWIIHHKGWREDRHVPDYARTKRGFKPYRA